MILVDFKFFGICTELISLVLRHVLVGGVCGECSGLSCGSVAA